LYYFAIFAYSFIDMKKLLLYLFSAVLICGLGGLVVSCEKNKDNIRDQLNPIEVEDPEGTLEINDWDLYLKNGRAKLIATYRNADGLLMPKEIKVNPGNMESTIDGDHAIFEFSVPGSYTVSAGKLSINIKVME
jgi:hypothetical protein